jgi:hypothetical protein
MTIPLAIETAKASIAKPTEIRTIVNASIISRDFGYLTKLSNIGFDIGVNEIMCYAILPQKHMNTVRYAQLISFSDDEYVRKIVANIDKANCSLSPASTT